MSTIIDEVDYGPLAQLIGKWVGTKGLDTAPDANANPDDTAFSDEIVFTAAGPAENAEEQNLVSIKYHHIVRKLENGHVFHDQIGHWIYEKSTDTIMHSLSIPRGVCLLAGGKYQENNGESIFSVKAEASSQTYGIIQSPFMLEKARTKAFKMNLSVKHNELNYHQITSLHIYEKDFEHIDKSTLFRVRYEQD
ncbi:MAG: FABP family protein [Crocinitomicaceae bacterium]|nr:FABP family protein [Crocinitomicaceae bacterium]